MRSLGFHWLRQTKVFTSPCAIYFLCCGPFVLFSPCVFHITHRITILRFFLLAAASHFISSSCVIHHTKITIPVYFFIGCSKPHMYLFSPCVITSHDTQNYDHWVYHWLLQTHFISSSCAISSVLLLRFSFAGANTLQFTVCDFLLHGVNALIKGMSYYSYVFFNKVTYPHTPV